MSILRSHERARKQWRAAISVRQRADATGMVMQSVPGRSQFKANEG
jgi:hypothetical protein